MAVTTYRTKHGEETKSISKGKAIRLFCLECVGWSYADVDQCTSKKCVLYPFRFGKDPGIQEMCRKRAETEKQAKMLKNNLLG